MATIDLATKLGASLPQSVSQTRPVIAYHETIINLATAATTKGSALAAADVIQCIDIPPESIVLSAGFEVITANTGSTVLTFHLGTTVDVDAFAASFDMFAAAVGDYSVKPLAGSEVVQKAAGTVDLTIATLTTTNTGGSVRVFALIADVADRRAPGLTALKS